MGLKVSWHINRKELEATHMIRAGDQVNLLLDAIISVAFINRMGEQGLCNYFSRNWTCGPWFWNNRDGYMEPEYPEKRRSAQTCSQSVLRDCGTSLSPPILQMGCGLDCSIHQWTCLPATGAIVFHGTAVGIKTGKPGMGMVSACQCGET